MARAQRVSTSVALILAGVGVGAILGLILSGNGTAASWSVIIAAIVGAMATVGASVWAERFRIGMDRAASQERRVERHADSLVESAFQWLPATTYVSDLHQLGMTRAPGGICISVPNSGNIPVERLKLWKYAVIHLQQDKKLGPAWARLLESRAQREILRSELERRHRELLEQALNEKFGEGWVAGSNWATPQPARWYGAEVIWNWMRSHRVIPTLADSVNRYSYGRADIADESRREVGSPPQIVLSLVDDGIPRAEEATHILQALSADPTLVSLERRVLDLDTALENACADFARVASDFYEYVSESKALPGTCPVCPP